MGHERIGVLPKSRTWRNIVNLLADSSNSPSEIAQITNQTLENVKNKYLNIHLDSGVQAAFGFLVALSSENLPPDEGKAGIKIPIDEKSTPLNLVRHLNDWITQNSDSLEYAELAKRAAADTIAFWMKKKSSQGRLFDSSDDASLIWREASNGAGFSEISRVFFSKFTERYLKYFLEREASASFNSLSQRREFEIRMKEHVEKISLHSFETSKITQSFAAGWYNNHARKNRPNDNELTHFLSKAFSKLREEFSRETKGK